MLLLRKLGTCYCGNPFVLFPCKLKKIGNLLESQKRDATVVHYGVTVGNPINGIMEINRCHRCSQFWFKFKPTARTSEFSLIPNHLKFPNSKFLSRTCVVACYFGNSIEIPPRTANGRTGPFKSLMIMKFALSRLFPVYNPPTRYDVITENAGFGCTGLAARFAVGRYSPCTEPPDTDRSGPSGWQQKQRKN